MGRRRKTVRDQKRLPEWGRKPGITVAMGGLSILLPPSNPVFCGSLLQLSLRWPSGPAEDAGYPSAGQQQRRVSLPSSTTARTSHLEGRNTAETRGSLWFL
uniref:Uncharacterized protein n=1 Tax=Otus sunia TaxID=257818 RepID=A0A8C8AEQ1_9STRI